MALNEAFNGLIFMIFFFFFDTWLCSYQAKAAAELHKKTSLDHMVCIF